MIHPIVCTLILVPFLAIWATDFMLLWSYNWRDLSQTTLWINKVFVWNHKMFAKLAAELSNVLLWNQTKLKLPFVVVEISWPETVYSVQHYSSVKKPEKESDKFRKMVILLPSKYVEHKNSLTLSCKIHDVNCALL